MSTAKVKQAPAAAKAAAPQAAPQAAAKPAAAAPAAAAPAVGPVAAEAAQQIEQAVSAGKESIEGMVKASQDAASKGYEKAAAVTKEQVEAAVKAQTQVFKSYEEAIQAARENVDAVVKSGSILARGLQDLSKTVLGLTQDAIEDSVAASKQIMAAKTLREWFDLQADAAKIGFDRMMSESTRLADLSVTLAEEAFAPLNDRVYASMDKLARKAG